MIEHVWSVFCSRVLIDKDANNVSLVDVIEQFTLTVPPPIADKPLVVPNDSELVSLWSRAADDRPCAGTCRVVWKTAAQEEKELISTGVDLTINRRLRTRLKIRGLLVQKAGRYEFRVDLREEPDNTWKTVARIPVEVGIGIGADAEPKKSTG